MRDLFWGWLLAFFAIIFLFQNFSIKHFPLPLPSQKKACIRMLVWEVHYKAVFEAIASVAQLARAADL